MKTTTTKTLLSSLLLAGALLAVPATTFAVNLSADSSVNVNSDGIFHVVNAEVTSISGNLINAVTTFKNNVVNWTFATNASTTVAAKNNNTSLFSDIHIGDKLNVTGTLAALGSTISVNATKVRDMTASSSIRTKTGIVQSVNLTNGSFIIKSNDKTTTVQTNASTTIRTGTTTGTLAALALNSKVAVTGLMNADNTIMTATKVMILAAHDDIKKSKKEFHAMIKDLRLKWKADWKLDKESHNDR